MSDNGHATTDLAVMASQDMGMTPVVNVATALRRIKDLQDFVKAVMVKDEDYGTIPGTQKPTLYKSGAEKLCEMYGLAPTCTVTNRIEQWEAPFFQYEMCVRLVSKATGVIVAEGIGSCNSREKRYRNQDAYTIVNTLQKMAKKRALVDAALSATRSSGLFTQDLEDLQEPAEHGPAQRPVAAARPSPRPNDAATPATSEARASAGFDRPRIEKLYLMRVDKADVLGISADSFNPKWTDEDLVAKGRDLAGKIAAKETEMESREPVAVGGKGG